MQEPTRWTRRGRRAQSTRQGRKTQPCGAAAQPHSHTATQPHSHTATQPHSHTATQPHSHTATQPHNHPAMLSHMQWEENFPEGEPAAHRAPQEQVQAGTYMQVHTCRDTHSPSRSPGSQYSCVRGSVGFLLPKARCAHTRGHVRGWCALRHTSESPHGHHPPESSRGTGTPWTAPPGRITVGRGNTRPSVNRLIRKQL